MDMQIDITAQQQAQIVTVSGEVDLYSSPKMREAIFKALKQHHPSAIIIDLTDVTYTDSSGIATLVEGLQFARSKQAQFILVGLSPAVLEVFQLVRLQTVFKIFPTVETALTQIAEAA